MSNVQNKQKSDKNDIAINLSDSSDDGIDDDDRIDDVGSDGDDAGLNLAGQFKSK